MEGAVPIRLHQHPSNSSVSITLQVNKGGIRGSLKALTKAYEPRVKNIPDIRRNAHVEMFEKALRVVAGALKKGTPVASRSKTSEMKADRRLPQKNHHDL